MSVKKFKRMQQVGTYCTYGV